MDPQPLRVGVLLYEGCFASEAFAVIDMLTVANRVAEFGGAPARFSVSAVAVRPGQVLTANGLRVHAPRMNYALDRLVVPGFNFAPGEAVPGELEHWRPEVQLLRRAADRGIPIASVCVGAFLLGTAGLLDGRRAATAWFAADELATRFPEVLVQPTAVVVEDGPVTTTGAFSASSDLALHLIRIHAGQQIARATARLTLTSSGRDSQSPYVDEQLAQRSRGAFSVAVRAHLLERLGEAYDLAGLADAFHVSTRTLLRRFQAETGQTPLDFLQAARVGHAKRLLETTDLGVGEIASVVGYQDPGTFRRLFDKHAGMSLAHYRRTFR